MVHIRKRITVQIIIEKIIENRKTEIKTENRKQNQGRHVRGRSLRRIFFEEKPKKHQTASNSMAETGKPKIPIPPLIYDEFMQFIVIKPIDNYSEVSF